MSQHLTSDTIHLRDLAISCIVGTRPAERRRRRRVVLQVALACDLAQAGATDDIRQTVDYAAVCARIVAVVRPSRCLFGVPRRGGCPRDNRQTGRRARLPQRGGRDRARTRRRSVGKE